MAVREDWWDTPLARAWLGFLGSLSPAYNWEDDETPDPDLPEAMPAELWDAVMVLHELIAFSDDEVPA